MSKVDFKITNGIDDYPETLLLFGPPKIGKTTVMAELTTKKDFLLIDLEPKDGAKYVTGRKVRLLDWKQQYYPQLADWQVFLMLLQELERAKQYKGIIIDNLSILEDYCKDWAMKDWNASQIGIAVQNKRKMDGIDLIKDPYNIPGEMGSPGYGLVREKFMAMKYNIERCADHIVYVGHTKIKLKTKSYSENEDVEVEVKELDLTGQLKRIMMQHVSCIGYLFRPGDTMQVTMKADDSVTELGSRVPRLNDYQGNLDWQHIYAGLE